MGYLVDSDWFIDHLKGTEESAQLLRKLASEGISISVVTYMEAYQGLARTVGADEAQRVMEIVLSTIPVIVMTAEIARRCATLREQLREAGKRTNSRNYDVVIAATAVENKLTLVTRNTRDFRDIPGLELYVDDSQHESEASG